MSSRITLKDVAQEAGVHISTASRALNPLTSSVVNPETLERVAAAARMLGYRPHPLARGLRTNRSMSVGMVIPDVENPLFGPIIAGAEAVLVDDGYSVLIGNADGDPASGDAVIASMLERHVDGLILATATRSDSAIDEVKERGIPMVLANRTIDDGSVPAIVGDDHAGIGLAVEHLASLGHQRIGHVAGPSHVSTGLGRRRAFTSWIQEFGLDSDPDLVEEADWFQVDPGYRSARELLKRHPELTAIVAANDLIGLGCYRAIRSLDKEVAVDVSVTGYNDTPLMDLMQPAMTAVRVPYRQMGTQAATTLLSQLSESSNETPASIKLSPSLSVRASTAPPSTD